MEQCSWRCSADLDTHLTAANQEQSRSWVVESDLDGVVGALFGKRIDDIAGKGQPFPWQSRHSLGHSMLVHDLEGAANALGETLQAIAAIRHAFAKPPDRTGPAGVSFVACHDMHVKLTDDIAKCADIDLGAGGQIFQSLGNLGGFETKGGLVERRQVVLLNDGGPLRDQNQPWPAHIVAQSQLAKTKSGDSKALTFQALIENKICHSGWS